MSSPVRIGVLKTMPTSGILNWLKRKTSPEIHKLARTVADTVSKMGALRVGLAQAAQSIERDMDDFTREYGSEALAELRFTSRINGVDPLAFGTVENALKGDAVLEPIEAALLKNSNNKAETRRLIDEVKAQVTKTSDSTQVFKDDVKLSTPVRTKLNALTKLAIDNSKVPLKVEQLAVRTQEIRDTYIAKEALSKQKGGLALYKAERDYHKDMFDARVALLDERATDSFNPEQAKQVRAVRAEIMREVQSPEERKKGGDLFYDIDPELFAKDYFPMVRDGYAMDVIGAHATAWGADAIITLFDAWAVNPDNIPSKIGWYPWFPIDTEPVHDLIVARLKRAREFLEDTLRAGEACAEEGLAEERWLAAVRGELEQIARETEGLITDLRAKLERGCD
jgi:hypothetical protein